MSFCVSPFGVLPSLFRIPSWTGRRSSLQFRQFCTAGAFFVLHLGQIMIVLGGMSLKVSFFAMFFPESGNRDSPLWALPATLALGASRTHQSTRCNSPAAVRAASLLKRVCADGVLSIEAVDCKYCSDHSEDHSPPYDESAHEAGLHNQQTCDHRSNARHQFNKTESNPILPQTDTFHSIALPPLWTFLGWSHNNLCYTGLGTPRSAGH